jgi:PAS domain S-box-containing protein
MQEHDQGTDAKAVNERSHLREQLAEKDRLEDEYHHVLAALREIEQRYLTLFECIDDAVFIESLADDIIDANPQACALMGYTRDELMKMKVSDLQAPEARGKAGEVVQDELSKYPGRKFESVNIRRDGSRIPVEISNSPLGNTGLVFSIVRDITRRKQAQAALLSSEARWQYALEGAGDGVWDWDMVTNTVFLSRQWKAMLGYEDNEIPHSFNEWSSRLHPDDREATYAQLNAHISGQAPSYTSEHRLRCKNGQYLWILARGKIVQWAEDGAPLRMIGTNSDISQRRQMENRLRENEEQYRLLVENAPDAIFVQTNGRFAFVNTETLKLVGARSADQLLGQPVEERFPPVFREVVRSRIQKLNENQVAVPLMEEVFLRLDGSQVDVEVSAVPFVYGGSNGALVFMRDISQRKQAEERLRWTAEVNAAVARLYQPLTALGATMQEIAGEVLDQARELTRSKHGYISEIDPVSGSNVINKSTGLVGGQNTMPGSDQKIVLSRGEDGRFSGLLGESLNTRQAFYTNSPGSHLAAHGAPQGHMPIERFLSVPVLLGEELVGQISLANPDRDYTEFDLNGIERLAGFYALAIQRLRKEQELRRANETLARAQHIAHLGSWQRNLATGDMNLSSEMYQILGFPAGSVVTRDDVLQHIPLEDRNKVEHIMRSAISNSAPYQVDFRFTRPDGQERVFHDEGAIINDEKGEPASIYGTTLDITARYRAEQGRQKQLERLEALHEIDKAVAASQDMKIMFDTLLQQVTRQLKVDAADILLYEPGSQTLDYARGLGFQTSLAEKTSLPAGRGFAGQAIMNRRQVLHNPLPGDIQNKDHGLFALEGFQMYVGVPLISKGQVKGVLEVFHRSPVYLDQDWMGYLEILAGQAAIAIDNLQMLENLQRANTDLGLAYDITLEGWSRALDLRDKETEGHSRRVMELTVRVAQAMGINNEKLVHAYRGALLHDIGKMGVPDEILHKPGSLTPEEWEKVRQHPALALDLLSPIPYLRQALEIPYCHHEKWDGSGYPRGLHGPQIPLSARIFAVVDTWDAMHSARPYRAAWPREKVIAYIKEQSGRQFDPEVVEIFLDVIKERRL